MFYSHPIYNHYIFSAFISIHDIKYVGLVKLFASIHYMGSNMKKKYIHQ